MPSRLVLAGIGSTDWRGATAPAGGTHTGITVLFMGDGTEYTVAHSHAEVLQKTGSAPPAPPGWPQWVAFDVPGSATPVILDVTQITDVESGGLLLGPLFLLGATSFLATGDQTIL